MRKKTSLLIIICFLLSLSTLFSNNSYASQDKVVTVAYIDYNNFITKMADGSYTGYGVDYLNHIAEYTGWEYKYVEMDWPTAYQAVKDGSIDFYCAARDTRERMPYFDFSLFPICYEKMNVYTLPEKDIFYENFDQFDGLRVGMLESSGEMDYFKQYAEQNEFRYTLLKYPTNEDVKKALQEGKVDAIALVNYAVNKNFKMIGNFGISPAFMMSKKGSKKLKEFSNAQEKIFYDSDDFLQTLENKYYYATSQMSNLYFTKEEADYIQNAGTLKVALSDHLAPIEYYDKSYRGYNGLTVDICKKISKLTGLNFSYASRDHLLISELDKNQIQLVGALTQSQQDMDIPHLEATKSFTDSAITMVTHETEQISKDATVAVPIEYPVFNEIARQNGYNKVIECEDLDECLHMVEDGEADLTYIPGMCENYLINHVYYKDLQTLTVRDSVHNFKLCLYVNDDPVLLSIINKCIDYIPDHEISAMQIENIVEAEPEWTVNDFISKYTTALFVYGIIFMALLSFVIVRMQKTKQRKMLNLKLQKHQEMLQHLFNTLPCGIIRYSYDYPHTIISYNETCAKIYGYELEMPIIGETPESVVKIGTEETFLKKFELCKETGHTITYIWPITRKDGLDAYVECVMDITETEQGNVFQEVFIDVTERIQNEQLIEKRYYKELHRNNDQTDGLLYTACFDVNKQTLELSDIDVPGIHCGMSFDEFLDFFQHELEELQSKEQLEILKARFSRERLQQEYEEGNFEQDFKVCHRTNGQIQWLRSDIVLRQNPMNGHLMCFDYIRDITNEEVTGQIIRYLALSNCEAFMCIDAKTGSCLEYTVGEQNNLLNSEAMYGTTDLLTKYAETLKDNVKEELLKASDSFKVFEELNKADNYQIYATNIDEDGKRVDKAFKYFYVDRLHKVVAMVISDVTEVRSDEVRHAKLLSDALALAEKADIAKSQFLSRVSHEMRTPLNAIIGFIELSKDADEIKKADYLASSDIAAKQLLNVINDVLDMSSIESGKMKIAMANFNFMHLISSITNIYGLQCKQKDVEYQTKMTTPTDEWLIGDELRVNQILMNLLGNAVKFTSEGHIHLTITETPIDEKKLFLRFIISDTGCGMSEQMKERLFKPFEQENATTAQKYGGSGLGLSIVKNLVAMMQGTIRVESVQGEGTTFTVDLPFERSPMERDNSLPQSMNSLRVLVVDDEERECEYMGQVLKRMGINFKCVSSGKDAIAELTLAKGENNSYNVCLLDWQMPDMNGLDTAKKIREAYGKDMMVIIVSAFDFQQNEKDIKEAGADLFLSKPIFQSSLFDLFMSLTGGKIAEPKKEPQNWDFTGKRILLAEDNALNQVVAVGFLTKFNFTVEVAENGQIAVDMFLSSKKGYFDAILMDVQMPVMGGFEATKKIRESSHSEAKTIPIIAQTANAFNEDIARALSAGMNDHIAKPIKPDVLARTLFKALSKD